jgi:hypothetical protein
MVCRLSRDLNARRKGFALIPALVAIVSLGAPALSASAASPSADLATTINSPYDAHSHSYLFYTITVTNHGPDPASNVASTDGTPSRATFYCVGSGWCGPLSTGVFCTHPPVGSPGTVSCTIASLPSGASMTVTMIVRTGLYFPFQAIWNSATATSSTFDPNTANNTATVVARVIS